MRAVRHQPGTQLQDLSSAQTYPEVLELWEHRAEPRLHPQLAQAKFSTDGFGVRSYSELSHLCLKPGTSQHLGTSP